MKTDGDFLLPMIPDSSRIFFKSLDKCKRMCYIYLVISV